jgi:hypothetical protein
MKYWEEKLWWRKNYTSCYKRKIKLFNR